MQIPSASPKSLRQPSQLARGALPHPGGDKVWRGCPASSGNATLLLLLECVQGSWQLLPLPT